MVSAATTHIASLLAGAAAAHKEAVSLIEQRPADLGLAKLAIARLDDARLLVDDVASWDLSRRDAAAINMAIAMLDEQRSALAGAIAQVEEIDDEPYRPGRPGLGLRGSWLAINLALLAAFGAEMIV